MKDNIQNTINTPVNNKNKKNIKNTKDQEIKRYHKKLSHEMGKAIADYNLIRENDRIMVCVSGGKDSLTLLHLLAAMQKKAPISFSLFAFTLDQAQPGFDSRLLEQFYKKMGIEYIIHKEDTYSIVTEKIKAGKTYCSLCSRLRRGVLYTQAQKLNATAIAMGHHAMDAAETLMLNFFYAGRLASMPPLLYSDEHKHRVIRPLIYADETDIEAFAKLSHFPIIPCNLCNNQENLQRARIKKILNHEIEKNPAIRYSMKKAMQNIEPRHLWDLRYQNQNKKIEK